MRSSFAFLSLTLASTMLVAQPSTRQNDDWNAVKSLQHNQQIRVSLRARGTHKGALLEATDNTLTIGNGKTLSREDIQSVHVKCGHRGKHVLIGAGIGAGAGLALGAGIDNSCGPKSIVCTGNRGKAIGAPLFALIGAGVGALLPGGGWEEIYRTRQGGD